MYLEVNAESGDGMVRAMVKGVEDLGSYRIMALTLAGQTLKARLSEDQPVSGDEVWLAFPPQWIRLFADGRLIR
jgi:glycerol transport system ATP-binding protein